MRRFVVIFLLLSGFVLQADRDCAEALVGITVVDTEGKPVADARVRFKFYTSFDDYNFIETYTDRDGRSVVRGQTRGEVYVGIEKDGYYMTTKKLKCRNLSWEESVTTKKWSSDIVENALILKPIIKPIRMQMKTVRFKKPPIVNKPIPYDILLADWCAPYGNGKIRDVDVSLYSAECTNRLAYAGMRLEFPNCVDGVYASQADAWSVYRYCYRVDTNAGFKKCLEQGRLPQHKADALTYEKPDEDSYHVVRFRTMTNEVGRVVSAKYGVIFGSLSYSGGLTFSVEINPDENEINIESDWALRNMKREKGR